MDNLRSSLVLRSSHWDGALVAEAVKNSVTHSCIGFSSFIHLDPFLALVPQDHLPSKLSAYNSLLLDCTLENREDIWLIQKVLDTEKGNMMI